MDIPEGEYHHPEGERGENTLTQQEGREEHHHPTGSGGRSSTTGERRGTLHHAKGWRKGNSTNSKEGRGRMGTAAPKRKNLFYCSRSRGEIQKHKIFSKFHFRNFKFQILNSNYLKTLSTFFFYWKYDNEHLQTNDKFFENSTRIF